MELWRIDRAVKGLCQDVESFIQVVDHKQMTEVDLAYELVICILGSGVKYETCVSYAHEMRRRNFLSKKFILSGNSKDTLEEVLVSPVENITEDYSCKKYRHPKKGAGNVFKSLYQVFIEYGCFKSLIKSSCNFSELRREIIRICPGIGPKQASHFLKNIGYTDNVAILDRHIIKYLELSKGINITGYSVSRIEKYEEIESQFIRLAGSFGFSASIVDQSLWFVMRSLNGRAFV